MTYMRRRDFIALLGGGVAIWPAGVLAQQPERVMRVGVLTHLIQDDPEGREPLPPWQRRTTVWHVITSRDAGVRGRTVRAPGRVQDNDGMSGEHHGDGRASDSGRHHVSHRPSTSTAWTRAAFAAIVLLLSLAAPVAAGPLEDATAAYNRGDYATALRLLRPLADQGDASAQNILGLMYRQGRGVLPDDAEALKWFRLAADQGTASAQFNLGIMYANGEGVPQNSAEALKLYRLAADQGTAHAQVSVGHMYYHGTGVPQDYAEALKWYRLAADQGSTIGQFDLGLMYENGHGVPQDYVRVTCSGSKDAPLTNGRTSIA